MTSIKKYNIALLPLVKSEEIIKYAQRFAEIADHYKLGSRSLPHITLSHFQAEEIEIEAIWKKVCEALSHHTIEIELNDISCVALHNTFWISLIPNQQVALQEMYKAVVNCMPGLTKKSYEPHLTLVNTNDREYMKKAHALAKRSYIISDIFVLSLGESDPCGQYTKVLYTSKMKGL